jgi:adenylate cyclase
MASAVALGLIFAVLAGLRLFRGGSPESPSETKPPSIAVLPFANMSGDPEQEYFADGITETLITNLARIPSIIVIARQSTFQFKGKDTDVRSVAKELGVGFVLEGSVQRSEGRVRVSAQLIDAAAGTHIWADTYDRKSSDIFAVQDDITRHIVSQLSVSLGSGASAYAFEATTSNAEAYDLFLKASQLYVKHSRETHAKAQPLLEEAIRIDPAFAAALNLLGNVHMDSAFERWSVSPEQDFQRAKEFYERSVAARPDDPFGYAGLGWHAWIVDHDLTKGVALGRRALRLAPNSALAQDYLGAVLTWSGEPEEGLVHLEAARRLCPLPYASLITNLGWANFILHHYLAALEYGEKARAMAPQHGATMRLLIVTLVEMGRPEEARQVAQELLRAMPSFSVSWYRDNVLPLTKGEAVRQRLMDGMRAAGIPETTPVNR